MPQVSHIFFTNYVAYYEKDNKSKENAIGNTKTKMSVFACKQPNFYKSGSFIFF